MSPPTYLHAGRAERLKFFIFTHTKQTNVSTNNNWTGCVSTSLPHRCVICLRVTIPVPWREDISEDFALSRVGSELDVVIDSFNPDFDAWVGRTILEAPDIDPIVFISEPAAGSGLPALATGQMRRCRVSGTSTFDLEADPLN